MLTIEHLTKQFGEKTLFRDLCLTVEGPAVLWAPSGWGKTTLLRILMGLDTPTAGRVQGVSRAAAVFQEDRLCPQLTALQNVTLVLPGSEKQYKGQIEADFQQLGMDTAEAAYRPAAGPVGTQRHSAAGRTLYRHGPGHPCRRCCAAAHPLRDGAGAACHPRPGGHPAAGLACD